MNTKTTVQEAVQMIQEGKDMSNVIILFTDKVETLDAIKLQEAGFEVPEDLVYTDYEAINYEDIPDITGKEVWVKGLPS